MLLLWLLLICQDQNGSDNWVTITPPQIGAQIQMPSTPIFSEQKLQPVRDQEEITVRSRSAMMPSGKENLTFVYHDEHTTPTTRTQTNKVLDGAVTGAIALVNGEIVRQSEIFLKSHKGRDFVYRCELEDAKLQTTHKLKIRTRVLLVRNRLFSMNYIAEYDSYDDEVADRFFESFELVNRANDLPPRPRPGRARQLAQEK